MRRGPLSAVLAGTLVLASVPMLATSLRGGAPAPQPEPTEEQQACVAPASWFPTTPQPVNFQVSDNCSFHQWAWQEFLWLTQGSSYGGGGQPNFLGFAFPEDLFVANPPPYPGRAAGELLDLLPRDRKDDETINVDAIAQAGTNNILIDRSGRPVYYIIQIDSTWYNFARSNGYNNLANRLAAPDTQNFPTSGPGAIELKSSWRVAQVGDSVLIPNAASRFITVQANIAPVTISGGKFVVDTANPVQATMAMAGMHVTGTVPNHPEFIWATFEHVDNAPVCKATPAGTNNPATGQPWSLYTGNPNCTSTFGPCNKGQGVGSASFNPTPICQMNAFGDTSSTSPNAQNIQSINTSVAGQLTGARALLRNYVLVGGQWTFPGGLPAITKRGLPTNIRGSSLLANTSMESFTQTSNCFSCHNSHPDSSNFTAKNISVSHVWPLPPTMRQNRVTVAPRSPARPAEYAGTRR
jgi:hypothetical protein